MLNTRHWQWSVNILNFYGDVEFKNKCSVLGWEIHVNNVTYTRAVNEKLKQLLISKFGSKYIRDCCNTFYDQIVQ